MFIQFRPISFHFLMIYCQEGILLYQQTTKKHHKKLYQNSFLKFFPNIPNIKYLSWLARHNLCGRQYHIQKVMHIANKGWQGSLALICMRLSPLHYRVFVPFTLTSMHHCETKGSKCPQNMALKVGKASF